MYGAFLDHYPVFIQTVTVGYTKNTAKRRCFGASGGVFAFAKASGSSPSREPPFLAITPGAKKTPPCAVFLVRPAGLEPTTSASESIESTKITNFIQIFVYFGAFFE